MRIHASQAAVLAALHLLGAGIPCPSEPVYSAGTLVVKLEASAAQTDASDPCHSEPSGEMRVKCPCGCGDASPGQDPVRNALAKSLFVARQRSFPAAEPVREEAPERSLRAGQPDEIDHVPIAA